MRLRYLDLIFGIGDLVFACVFFVLIFFLPSPSVLVFLPALVFAAFGARSIYKALHGHENDAKTVRDIEEQISSLSDEKKDNRP